MKKLLIFGLVFLCLISFVYSARTNITQNILDQDIVGLYQGPDGNRVGFKFNFTGANYTNITFSYKEYQLANTPNDNFTLYVCNFYANGTPDDRPTQCVRVDNGHIGSQAMTNERWYNYTFFGKNLILNASTNYFIVEGINNTQTGSEREYRISSANTGNIIRYNQNRANQNWQTATAGALNMIIYGDIYTSPIPPPPTYTPNMTGISRNMTNNTLGQLINFSCGNNVSNLWFGTTNPPTTLVINQSTAIWNNYYLNVTTIPSANDYYYIAGCNGTGNFNSSTYRFTYDTTAPSITRNPTTSYASDNSSIIYYPNNFTINYTFTDAHQLYAIQINITNNAGQVFYNLTNESLTTTSYNLLRTINLTGWAYGKYKVSILSADTHNPKVISYDIPLTEKLYDVVKSEDKKMLTFNTLESNKIKIYSTDAAELTEIRQQDKYELAVKYNKDLFGNVPTTKRFIVEFEQGTEAKYIKDSEFTGHLVFFNWAERNGNYVDFVGLTGDIKVTRKKHLFGNEYYEIEAKNNYDTEIVLHSIGGLNVNQVDYSFNYTALTITNSSISPVVVSDDNDVLFYCNATENLNNAFYFNYMIFRNETKIINGSVSYSNYNNQKYNVYNISYLNTSLNERYIVSCQASNTYYSTSYLNSSSKNITLFSIDDCTSNADDTLNITFVDSLNNAIIINYEATLVYWNLFESNNLTYSSVLTNTTKFSYCLSPSGINLTGQAQIRYTEPTTNTKYDYFLYNSQFTSSTSSLVLTVLNGTTQVLFSVIDVSGNGVSDVYINILKYNVGTGAYTTTEIIKTDTNGNAVGNIILSTEFYQFILYKDGVIIHTENGVKLITNTKKFYIPSTTEEWYTNYDTTLGIATNLYFNNVTNNFVFTWSDSSGLMHNGCLRVDKENRTKKTTLSDSCVASTSSSIVVGITPENSTSYIAQSYFKYDDIFIDDILIIDFRNISNFFKQDPKQSLFYGFLLCLLLLFIGLPNPYLSLILLGIGIIITSALHLIELTLLQVVTLIILIGIQIYISRKQQA